MTGALLLVAPGQGAPVFGGGEWALVQACGARNLWLAAVVPPVFLRLPTRGDRAALLLALAALAVADVALGGWHHLGGVLICLTLSAMLVRRYS